MKLSKISNTTPVSCSVDLPRVELTRVTQNVLEREIGLRRRNNATSNLPVVGVERLAGRAAGPDDGNHTHGKGDRANTVIDIAVGRTHRCRGHTKDLLNGMTGPAKLSHNLLGRERGEGLGSTSARVERSTERCAIHDETRCAR